jgi:hypothetical protein
MLDPVASQFASVVPVYVVATEGGFDVRDSASGETYSTEPSIRAALDQALALAGLPKKPTVLYGEDGAPNGVWKWLPTGIEEATANELDGVKLSSTNLWQLASTLDDRQQAMPIDGDGGPPGMIPSRTHGLAEESATLANAWAHDGVIVVDGAGRAGLYVHAEILPELAPEVDRGRLAFTSLHFGHSKPNQDGSVDAVELKTIGFTNRPVDKQIPPASSVRGHKPASDAIARRTTRITMADKTRGPAMDVLGRIAAALGIDLTDELGGDRYESKIIDAIYALKTTAQVEQITEGAAAGAPPPQQAALSQQGAPAPKRATMTTPNPSGGAGAPPAIPPAAVPGQRAADMPTGPAAEAALADLLTLGRTILGKPEMAAAEVIAELRARAEQLAAAATSTPGAPNAGPAGPAAQDAQMSARAQAESIVLRAKNDELAKDLESARAWRRTRENTDWLRAEITTRRLNIQEHERDEKGAVKRDEKGNPIMSPRFARLLSIAEKHGRELVLETLEAGNSPPRQSGRSLLADQTGTGALAGAGSDADANTAAGFKKLVDDCMDEARKSFGSRLASTPQHVVRAKAQEIAGKRFPQLDSGAGGGASGTAA